MINPQRKLYISLAIFLVISLSLIIFGVRPSVSAIIENSESFLAEKEKLLSFRKEKERFQEAKEIYERYEEDLEKIDDSFVNQNFPLEFILFLEKIATTSDLQMEISSGRKEARAEPWPSISYQITVNGFFTNLMRFLNRLENSSYLIEIVNLDISSESEESNLLESNLLLKVFTK